MCYLVWRFPLSSSWHPHQDLAVLEDIDFAHSLGTEGPIVKVTFVRS